MIKLEDSKKLLKIVQKIHDTAEQMGLHYGYSIETMREDEVCNAKAWKSLHKLLKSSEMDAELTACVNKFGGRGGRKK